MKYYLLKENGSQEYTHYPNHIILDGVWAKEYNEIVELTQDDYSLIIDALYEQAWENGQTSHYAKSLKDIANKLEKIFKEIR